LILLMSLTPLLDALFNGLSYSSILVLAALGLSITFGVMRVINMAHGEMLMLGAYTGWVVTDPHGLSRLLGGLGRLVGLNIETTWSLHLNLYAAIPIAFVVVGAFGYVLERGLIRFLYGRPLDTLLATWGVGLILQQLVRLIFGADVKSLDTPAGLSGKWDWQGATFPHFRIFVLVITGVCVAVIYWWFFRTTFGLKIRAVVQNRPMAAAMGIPTRQVDAWTFAFGTGLAGVAGCIVGPLYNVSPSMGGDYIVEAFMVVILGGTGQLAGTVAGGAVVGICQSVVAKFYNNSLAPGLFPAMISEVDQPMSKVTSLVLVIGFILIRPSGLFPTKERSYD
jgi:urea transport system permease protein